MTNFPIEEFENQRTPFYFYDITLLRKTLEEIKVIAPTLIKISGDIITEYYEDEEITNKLQ